MQSDCRTSRIPGENPSSLYGDKLEWNRNRKKSRSNSESSPKSFQSNQPFVASITNLGDGESDPVRNMDDEDYLVEVNADDEDDTRVDLDCEDLDSEDFSSPYCSQQMHLNTDYLLSYNKFDENISRFGNEFSIFNSHSNDTSASVSQQITTSLPRGINLNSSVTEISSYQDNLNSIVDGDDKCIFKDNKHSKQEQALLEFFKQNQKLRGIVRMIFFHLYNELSTKIMKE